MAVARPSTATAAKRTCFIVYLLIVSGCAGGNVSKARSISGSWASGVSATNISFGSVQSDGAMNTTAHQKRRAAPHGTAPCMVRAADQGATPGAYFFLL